MLTRETLTEIAYKISDYSDAAIAVLEKTNATGNEPAERLLHEINDCCAELMDMAEQLPFEDKKGDAA